MQIEITRIEHSKTHDLRHRILRPHQDRSQVIYPFDENPMTIHMGAFEEGKMVGIATALPLDESEQIQNKVWRLRGIAVLPEIHGKGIGRQLVLGCLEDIGQLNGKVVWCNARTSAAKFYERLGFAARGDEFEIEGIGPHFVYVKNISKS